MAAVVVEDSIISVGLSLSRLLIRRLKKRDQMVVVAVIVGIQYLSYTIISYLFSVMCSRLRLMQVSSGCKLRGD